MSVRYLVPACCALLAFAHAAAAGDAPAPLECKLEPGPRRAVVRVVDGETLRLDDGVEVRLIGALAPRASDTRAETDPSPWPPETATRQALAELVEGKSVSLAFVGTRADRHGRVYAHLFVADGDEANSWVQGRLVDQGLARAYALPNLDTCAAVLGRRERSARQANLGLWAHAAYQVRPADRPTELTRYRHTFQLVRGHVEKVRNTRSLAILELASNERPPATEAASQRGAFHILWPHRIAADAGLGKAGDWLGKNVLVRGWIETAAGPEIEISGKGQLESED